MHKHGRSKKESQDLCPHLHPQPSFQNAIGRQARNELLGISSGQDRGSLALVSSQIREGEKEREEGGERLNS